MSVISTYYEKILYINPHRDCVPRYLIDPTIKTLLKLSTLGGATMFSIRGDVYSLVLPKYQMLYHTCVLFTLKEIYTAEKAL